MIKIEEIFNKFKEELKEANNSKSNILSIVNKYFIKSSTNTINIEMVKEARNNGFKFRSICLNYGSEIKILVGIEIEGDMYLLQNNLF